MLIAVPSDRRLDLVLLLLMCQGECSALLFPCDVTKGKKATLRLDMCLAKVVEASPSAQGEVTDKSGYLLILHSGWAQAGGIQAFNQHLDLSFSQQHGTAPVKWCLFSS